jgi:radical SAM superfamily enzyme YgiQ (UPF0313 family)
MQGNQLLNILLLYPEMPNSFWSMQHTLKIIGKAAWYPPLGLATVAALLPEEWTKQLVDLNVDPLVDEDIVWADYVFLSAMNVQEKSVWDIIDRCNKLGAKIVAGGSLFTIEHSRFSGIDHFVLNEAEITLPLFISDLEAGKPKKVYSADEYSDAHLTPPPTWDLIDFKKYQYGIVQYSRGCPYRCDFCDVPLLYGNRPRTKTSDQIIAELNLFIKESTVPTVLFADDNLIGDRKALKNDLLPALIEWRRKHVPIFSFSTQVSINLADDPELMSLMLEAGFRHLFIGIETGDEGTLSESKKWQNTKRDLLENISILHQMGFIVVGGFIVGFDTDTSETFKKQTEFIQNSGILMATINMLKAPPGTPLYERLKSEDRLVPDFSFAEFQTNIEPVMTSEKLYQGFDEMIRKIYGPEFGVARSKTFLSEFNHLPDVVTDIPGLNVIEYLPVFFKIIFHIGIRYKGRKHFWHLVIWTIKNRLRLVDWALVNSIFIFQLHNLQQDYSKSISQMK